MNAKALINSDAPGLRLRARGARRYASLVRSVIYFTRELPGLSDELTEQGFQVYEALAISEVLYLCEHHQCLIVVIDHTIEPAAANEIAARRITLRPMKKATVRAWSGSYPSFHRMCRAVTTASNPFQPRRGNDPSSVFDSLRDAALSLQCDKSALPACC